MEVCQVLRRAISEMYIRGRASVTYVTCNGLAGVTLRIGIYTPRKIGNSRSRMLARCFDRRPEVDEYNVPMAQFAQEELYML